MAATQEISIVTDLLKEVESYLPEMSTFLRALGEGGSDTVAADEKELHRMTHTINGVAAMVQLEDLSRTATLMEDVLDDILAGNQAWNEELIAIMANTVSQIGAYCTTLRSGNADGAGMYRATREAFELHHASSTPAADELSAEDDDFAALFDDPAQETSANDLFELFADEEEQTEPGDEPAPLLSATDHAAFLNTDSSDNGEAELVAAPAQPLLSPVTGIYPELQESFNEEAEEHLDNIGRQLNELASSIGERSSVSDEYRERLHSIRRSVHTLKGAAAVIGIEAVAEWGHDFEYFLDLLHDESDTLSPEGIAVMQDGADILEKITLDPAVDMSAEIASLQALFPTITADASAAAESIAQERSSQSAEDEEPVAVNAAEESGERICDVFMPVVDAPGEGLADPAAAVAGDREQPVAQVAPKGDTVRISASGKRGRQIRKKRLRVGSEKITELMGLGGDMAINLSSFENSASSMQSTLAEFDMTLQRVKNIAENLESGYELAAIPHLDGTATTGRGDDGTMDEFDSLEMDRYSELHILIRALNEAVVDLGSIKEQSSEIQDGWHLALDKQRRVVGDVQNAVQSMQMTPFSTLANRLHKTVRESARSTGKKVRLLIDGGGIEMDTHIWDVLADALMHMLRNCVDHGVEQAEIRQQEGKPEQASIRINCSRRGSRFVLRLADDGGGLDYDGIRSRAQALYPEDEVAQMDNRDLAALIFKQGFSVRSQATSLSGRGVGMDVVRDALDQLNGFVEVRSRAGQGTEFVLSMPIIVAQLPALMVMFGSQQFAVPMRDVRQVLRITEKEGVQSSYVLDGASLPLLRPLELLHLKRAAEHRSSTIGLAVETGEGARGLLLADAVIGQRDVVFKSLGSHLQNVACVAGTTIMGDGSLVPILQTEDLFSLAETAARADYVHDHESGDEEKGVKILIVDDSISIRKVVSNFLTAQGWRVTAAHDGVEAMNRVRSRKPDLILLDIEMPRMNGFEVLQTLQSQTAYSTIPVILLTSRSAGKYREKAAALGARGFVTKPFQNDELLALISGLITDQPAGAQQ